MLTNSPHFAAGGIGLDRPYLCIKVINMIDKICNLHMSKRANNYDMMTQKTTDLEVTTIRPPII